MRKPPAMLARTSIRPNRSIVFAAAASTLFWSSRSVTMKSSFSSPCLFRSSSTRFAPSPEKCSATARPRVPAPPVTITVLPAKLMSHSLGFPDAPVRDAARDVRHGPRAGVYDILAGDDTAASDSSAGGPPRRVEPFLRAPRAHDRAQRLRDRVRVRRAHAAARRLVARHGPAVALYHGNRRCSFAHAPRAGDAARGAAGIRAAR